MSAYMSLKEYRILEDIARHIWTINLSVCR